MTTRPRPLEGEDELREKVFALTDKLAHINIKASYQGVSTPQDSFIVANEIMALIRTHTSTKEREADTVNRFEVINHLSDGSGREVIVWKGEPFKVEYSLQDDGRTLKVFLTDIAHLNTKEKDV